MKTKRSLIPICLLTSLFLPVICEAQPVVTNITAGLYHSLFIMTDGSLWGMGYNAQGALGTGNNNSVYSPVEITNHVFGFAAGGNHSLFFTNDPNHANLWAMGDNSEGEFGNGNNNNSIVPEPINITVGAFGLITRGSLATGSDHTLFVAGDDNQLWAMGRGDYGQLGYSGSPHFSMCP